MVDFTEKAIRDSFMKLLNEKPLKKITVKDIVDECGVNRNTFYYHFQSIPQLIETIIKDEADRFIDNHPKIISIEDCIDAIVGFTLENRKAVLHIYRSVNRDMYEQYQWRVCEYAVTAYLDEVIGDKRIGDSDRKILTEYLTCLFFGLATGWLEKGLTDDVNDMIHRICELKAGDLERIVEKCEIGD